MFAKTVRLIVGLVFVSLALAFSLNNDSPAARQSVVIGRASDENRFIKVRRAVDGDTLELENKTVIRLIGINAPETHHPTKGVERYGREAAAFAQKMLKGKKIRLEFDVETQDKYGRTLAYAYLEDGTFINAELVRQGYAQTMTITPNVKYAKQLLALQREARMAKRGFWGEQP